MRELEFLPQWYPAIRRRRRQTLLQLWLTGLVAIGLCLWQLMAHRNIELKAHEADSVAGNLAQTRAVLKVLEEQASLKQKLQVQNEMLAKIGTHIEAARMFDAIDKAMPQGMSLINTTLETEEMTSNTPAKSDNGKPAAPVQIRRYKVRLEAVAPSQLDLANFLASLTNVPFFENVTPTWAKDQIQDDHLMRRFEVTFDVNLSQTGA
jgi:hypothetical protein